MLFNSIDFAFFLPTIFFLYWFVFSRNLKFQNSLLLFSSYIFYGWWDYRFLFLILFSTVVDYFVGINLSRSNCNRKRRYFLYFSLVVNLGLLAIFKYLNFFIDNFNNAFSFFGYSTSVQNLEIILPVGISFYTFQTLSYTIDIYRRKLNATEDFINFATFVAFFPQLVAGPIEKAINLMPQLARKRLFSYPVAMEGIYQIFWGLFKKMVIADNAAELVNVIFSNEGYQGSILVVGAVLFAFQIYGDFSGYSDIAIGTSKLFGISLMTNFRFPYFSRDIAEFWRRWHISLSNFFKEYLYIPLGGSRGNTIKKVRNTFIIFLVSGFWHGANWTFIVWGFLNALYFIPYLLTNKNRKNVDTVAIRSKLPSFYEIINIGLTFSLTLFAWIFFRASSLTEAFSYLNRLINIKYLQVIPKLYGFLNTQMIYTFIFIIGLIVVEWFYRNDLYVMRKFYKKSILRQGIVSFIIILSLIIFSGSGQDFIYFQF